MTSVAGLPGWMAFRSWFGVEDRMDRRWRVCSYRWRLMGCRIFFETYKLGSFGGKSVDLVNFICFRKRVVFLGQIQMGHSQKGMNQKKKNGKYPNQWDKISPTYPWKIPLTLHHQFLKEFLFLWGLGESGVPSQGMWAKSLKWDKLSRTVQPSEWWVGLDLTDMEKHGSNLVRNIDVLFFSGRKCTQKVECRIKMIYR